MAFSVTWVSRLFQVHRRNKSVFPSLGKNIMYFQEIRIPPINHHHVSLGKGVSDGAWVLLWHQGLSSRFCFKKSKYRLCNGTKSSQANFSFYVCLVLKDLPEGSLAFPLQTVCAWASLQRKKGGFSRHVNMSLAAEISLKRDGYSFSHFINSCSLCMRTGAASPVFNWCCLWCLYSYEFLWCTLTLSILLRSSPARSLSDFLYL